MPMPLDEDEQAPPGLSRCRPVADALLAKSAVFTWVVSRHGSRRRVGALPACAADNYCSEYGRNWGPRKPRTLAAKLNRADSEVSTAGSAGPETKSPYMTRSSSMFPTMQSSTVSASSQQRISTPVRPSSSFGWTGPRLGGYNGPRDQRRPQSEIHEAPSVHRDERHKLLLNTDYERQFCQIDVRDKGGDRGGSLRGLIHGWEIALEDQERRCAASQKRKHRAPNSRPSPFASSATDLGQFMETRDRRPASMGLGTTTSVRPSSALRVPPEVKKTQAEGAKFVAAKSDYGHSFTSFPKQPKVESLTDKLYEGWQLALAETNSILMDK